MFTIYAYIFISIAIISLLSFVGVITLAWRGEKLKKVVLFLVGLSTGALLGGALLHLMPEVIADIGSETSVWLWLLAGIIIFFVLEKIICWRHCHIPTSENHPHPVGIMNLVGDGLHNFLDGLVIAGSFMVSLPLGIATSVAVIAHEIPQEIADFGVLIHAGFKYNRAILFNFLISLTAFAGALAAIILKNQIGNFSSYIIPFTAGGFIYIATADLIPELKKETNIPKSFWQLISILAGIGLMFALK